MDCRGVCDTGTGLLHEARKGEGPPGHPGGPAGRAAGVAYWRSTIIFLISAIALAGFRPFGQVRLQFMMVWQR